MGREKKVSPSHMLHQCYQQRPGELCWAFFTWKLPGHLVWGAWDPLQGQRYKRTFFTEGFLWSISQVFYFSDRHSKAGYTKEPLVLLVAQRLAGNTAVSGITSRVWTQSLRYHLSCLSSGNSISADSCWKFLFSTFKKITKSPTFSRSKTLWEFDNRGSSRYLCVLKQMHLCVLTVKYAMSCLEYFYKLGLRAENSGTSSLSLKLLRGFRVV